MLKHLDLSVDWTTRASGSLRGVSLELWERGILARLPGCLNQPIVGAAPEQRGPRPGAGRTYGWPPGSVLLMHDVTPWLVPVTDEPIPLAQHLRFLRHMAALHAAFWACGPELDVVPEMHRYLELSPWMAQAEAFMQSATGDSHLVPQLVAQGWPLLAQVAPAAAAVVTPLAYDPGPLVDALAGTPHTFVHSNWKLDNLGTDDEGRTVVLDWEQSGVGAPLSDLAWYLAINCRRLPQPKEASITVYREALEDCGIDTGAVVGPPAGPVPAGRPGPVRLGEGARRLRRGARLVGGEGGAGRSPAEVTADLRAAYEAAAGAWAAGPERVYAPLARALVLAAPVPVTGRRVLDLGAGTGVAGRAALAAGADRVVSADLAVAMLRLHRPGAASGGGRRRGAAVPRPGLRSRRGRVLPEPPGPSRRCPG